MKYLGTSLYKSKCVWENEVEKTAHVLDEVRLAVLQTEILCAEKSDGIRIIRNIIQTQKDELH